MSVDTLVIILGSFFARGLTYVARSRVRSFEGLHIVHTVQHQELTAQVMNLFADQSEVIHAEYIRLRRFLRHEGRRIISTMTFPEVFDAAAVIEGFAQFPSEDTNAEPCVTQCVKKEEDHLRT